MKKLLLIIFSFYLIGSASAQWSQLTSASLSATDYYGLVYTGTSVIMATEGGIFRSTDNGATWSLSVNGLDTTRIEANDITFIQSRNEIWITASGLYKSVNDGLTWSRVTPAGLSSNGWTQNISHVDNRLIITYNEWDSGLSTNVTKLCYSDNGTSWSYGATLGPESTSRWNFIADDNNYAVYIIESPNDNSGDKLWYSENGTSKVQHPTTGLGTSPRIRDRAFTVDPEGNNLFFMDESSSKIYWYNTSSWEVKMTGIGGAGFTIAGVLGLHNLGAHLFSSVVLLNASSEMSLKLYYSSDNGANWTAVASPGVDFPIFEDQMIVAGSSRIITCYFNSRICYSDDIGQTWTVANTIFSGEFGYLVGMPSGNMFTLTPDQFKGILKSTDNGNTWTQQTGDLISFNGIYLLGGLFNSNTTLYAVVTEDPFVEKQFLYKSENEGVNWTKITTGPDTKYKMFAGRHGAYPIIFFTDDENTGTYQYTPDGGASWVNISTGITPLAVDRVQGIKSNGTDMILFAEKSGKTRVYRSTNNGASFSEITFELGALNLEIIVANRYEWRALPSAVAGFNGAEFITSVIDYSSFPWSVDFYKLKSTFDGWVKAGTLGVPVSNGINWHALRNLSGVWYFSTPVGVYASINNCATWQRIWNNQGFQKGIRPSSILVNSYGVFLGTWGTGIWRAPITEPSLATLTVTDILDIKATGGASITSTGGLPFSNKGLCWATHSNPTTTDNVLAKGNSWSSFTGSLEPLTAGTQYYVKAFVQGPKGTTYGGEVTFTTTTTTGLEPEIIGGKIVVYPNPAKEVLNIRAESDYYMSMVDIIGRVVLSGPVYPGTSTYQISELPAGLYFLKVKGNTGNIQTIRVLIK